MAAPMWRMNGLWRRMAGVLVLCALLLSNEVLCQTDVADALAATSVTASDDAATPPVVTTVGDAAGKSASSAAPGIDSVLMTTGPNQVGDALVTSGTTAAPTPPPVVLDVSHVIKLVVPDVKCVGEDISDAFIMAEVATTNCEETKRIIQENPAAWCQKQNCLLKIFQDGNSMKLTSDDATLSTLLKALQSTQLNDQLGATNVAVNPSSSSSSSSSGSSVFVGILVSGLLAALAITVGYCKCQRRTDTKGVRLAEEAYPVDQENQGNTLVSVAPLNPPPEIQEKPSVNGESPEGAKTQPPPPTNGHSTTKTADTEL
ncbi:uncharacterized protein cd34 [Dicentrarchus labrax]|uniref:Hematopoietic progenitor cell antigen CD34 n=1 Tax=Dicentrarchus labrax TaxID=13489 RepID=A0A8P4G5U2_DICLA|nr:uncharacterized protein cd34 [Dicentrarchus labrax]